MAIQPREGVGRRRFLSYLLFGGAATLFVGFKFWGRPVGEAGSAREALIQEFLSLKTTSSRSRALGQSYLQKHAGEADLSWLETTIADSCRQQESTHDRRVDCNVEVQIRSEFARGCTVEVNGWILSRTEARLYALISLS